MSAIVKKQALANDDPSGTGFRALFDNFFSTQHPLFSLSEKVWNPPADVYETCDSVVIKMEIAGVKLDHLDISANPEENILIIRGCRRENPILKKENYHLMEIRYGQFERVFPMPVRVKHDEIEAKFSNGFLILTIPKKTYTTRDIPIHIQED